MAILNNKNIVSQLCKRGVKWTNIWVFATSAIFGSFRNFSPQRAQREQDLHRDRDGTIGGIKQDSNTFAWTCRYQLESRPERLERGTVTLVR